MFPLPSNASAGMTDGSHSTMTVSSAGQSANARAPISVTLAGMVISFSLVAYMNAPMRAAADCNGDGEVTAADAAKILRIVVQLESEEDLH